jgi:integrase
MSHTEPFDGNTIRKIAGQIAKGNAQGDVWKDYECVSLQIRVGKTSAAWSFKTRDNQVKIADFEVFGKDDIPALRDLVRQAKAREKAGQEVESFFREYVASRLESPADDVPDGGGMVWEQARDKYLAWLKLNRSRDTYRTYRSSLGAAHKSALKECFEPISGRPIAAITTADLAMVRNKINNRGKRGEAKGRSIRQADLTVAALKSAWIHFVNEPETFGIGVMNIATEDLRKVRDRDPRPESSSGATERTMNQLELGMFFEELGSVRNEMSRYVLSLELLTAQRRLDASSAIRESFVEREVYGMVWRLEDKTHAWRVLPLPPLAREIVDRALEKFASYQSRYLFPRNRKRRKSDPDVEGHISERTVSKMMEVMREEGGPFADSLLNPSTHDLRKAFVSYMTPRIHKYSVGGRQLTAKDVTMITHDDEGREHTATLVYDKNEYLDVKLAILTEWQDYVIEGLNMWHAEKERNSARRAA